MIENATYIDNILFLGSNNFVVFLINNCIFWSFDPLPTVYGQRFRTLINRRREVPLYLYQFHDVPTFSSS